MTEILDAGIRFIAELERLRTPALNQFFLLVTDLGSTAGYLVLLPIIWWAFSWKLGARLFVALVLSVYLNTLIKDVVALPRPFAYAPVKSLRTPSDFSFPSGHAQQAALVWGLLAMHFRKRWFTLLAILLVFLIGFSRVYLGVHFPTDVVAGWIVGAGLAWAYARWSGPLVERAASLGLRRQMALALGLPAVLTVLHPSSNGAMAMGALAGALGGLILAQAEGLYPRGERSRSRRAWLVTGFIGLPLVYGGLRLLAPGADSAYYPLYLWGWFATVGLYVSFAVPRIVAYAQERRNEI